jgi:CHAT domain-containing protein
VAEIAALWTSFVRPAAGAAERLTGARASETAFKTKARGRLVLHVATHGFFLAGRCASLFEAVNEEEGSVENGPPSPTSGENPLLLSGLALSGANHRDAAAPDRDDGILTADEVAAMDLSAVDWAVLSGCETGLGDVRAGEGVIGLRRAFQVAGVRTLIMSLGPIEDRSARLWMKALYEGRLRARLGAAEAVRAASLDVLRRRRSEGLGTHPFYWGGFVASGDWK